MLETHQQAHDNALSELTFHIGIIVFMLAISVIQAMRGEPWKANLLFLIFPAIGIFLSINTILGERRGLEMGEFRFHTLAEKDAYFAHVRELERESMLERDNAMLERENDELFQEINEIIKKRKMEQGSVNAGSAFPYLPTEIQRNIFKYKLANTERAKKRFSDAAQESAAALREYKYAEHLGTYSDTDTATQAEWQQFMNQTLEAKRKADATYKAAYRDLMKDRWGDRDKR